MNVSSLFTPVLLCTNTKTRTWSGQGKGELQTLKEGHNPTKGCQWSFSGYGRSFVGKASENPTPIREIRREDPKARTVDLDRLQIEDQRTATVYQLEVTVSSGGSRNVTPRAGGGGE